ncbi:hypothetical protein [Bartonella sp. B1099]|uniref:hypothetical protein n=1 Tax=Bartonella sp. B1099 TaxID=2911422 RepID=UPI0020C5256A|nr:hypothetical protein [Bartonella sp. B1099]
MQPRITAITGCHALDYIAFRDSVRISTRVYSTTGDSGSLTQLDSAAEHLPMLLGATSGTTGAMKMVSVRLKSSKEAVSSSERNLICNLRARQFFPQGMLLATCLRLICFHLYTTWRVKF